MDVGNGDAAPFNRKGMPPFGGACVPPFLPIQGGSTKDPPRRWWMGDQSQGGWPMEGRNAVEGEGEGRRGACIDRKTKALILGSRIKYESEPHRGVEQTAKQNYRPTRTLPESCNSVRPDSTYLCPTCPSLAQHAYDGASDRRWGKLVKTWT